MVPTAAAAIPTPRSALNGLATAHAAAIPICVASSSPFAIFLAAWRVRSFLPIPYKAVWYPKLNKSNAALVLDNNITDMERAFNVTKPPIIVGNIPLPNDVNKPTKSAIGETICSIGTDN